MGETPTWTLEATNGDLTGKVYTITEQGLSLGRGEFNDIVLNSNNVSRKHARIFVYSGYAWAQDLGSRNGIFINSVRVQQQALNPGDMVAAGEYIFRVGGVGVPTAANAPSADSVPKAVKSKKPLVIGGVAVAVLVGIIAAVGGGSKKPPAEEPAPQAQGGEAAPPADSKAQDLFNFQNKPAPAAGQVDPTKVDPNAKPADGSGGSEDRNAQLIKEYLDRALLYEEAGRLKEARDLLDRAVKQDGKCELCVTRLTRVTSEIARSTQKYYDDGLRYYNSLRYEEAIANWELVLNLLDDQSNELYRKTADNLAQAKQKLGRE